MTTEIMPVVRALCVGRHEYIAEHIARYFARCGADARHAVGMDSALEASRDFAPQVIIAEYELLTMLPLEAWERDPLLSRTAVIAVSLTRRPNEAHMLDVNGIAGFLYLPKLDAEAASRLLTVAASTVRKVAIPSSAGVSPVINSEAVTA